VKRLEKGFTKKIIESLHDYLTTPHIKAYGEGYYFYADVPSEVLLKVATLLPKENLEIRQNNSPRVADFIEVAKMEPRALFYLYVISEIREDERLSIEAVAIPSERKDVIKFILQKALAKPDYDRILSYEVYEGRRYMWWD
jgi:hypothetical protein